MTFKYQKPFPILKDDTEYRLVTRDFVSTINIGEREILKVEPEALELLAKKAFTDVSFYLRTAHLEKLASLGVVRIDTHRSSLPKPPGLFERK